MTTPERDVAAIRERHHMVTLPKGDSRERTRWQGCDFDEQPWPCDVAVLLSSPDGHSTGYLTEFPALPTQASDSKETV